MENNIDATLVAYNKFAQAMADTLNAAGFKPVGGEYGCGIIVLVHPKEMGSQPIGGGLNYGEGKWVVHVQLELPERIEE